MNKQKSNTSEQPDMDVEITEEEFKDDVMNALFGSNREAFERKKKAMEYAKAT